MVISNVARSWLLLIPMIPSILVSIFLLYHLLITPALRKAINNHVIILLLSFGLIEMLTDVVWLIYYYQNGIVLSSTPAFCVTWVFALGTLLITISILMAWASMERHILVFYPNWFATKAKRFFFHYLPLAICVVYPTTFYFVIFIILPCNLPFWYNLRLCSRYSCLIRIPWISLWDSIAHYIIPAFVIVIFSVSLLARVVYHRYRIRGQIDWRNYRKMTAQLLPISALYLLMQLPPMSLYAAYSAGLPWRIASDYYSDALFFNYWVILFTPFASIASLPDPKTKFKNLFLFWRRRNAVQPVATKITRRNVDQTVAVVPSFQPAMNEMARQNVNQTVSELPIVQ